MKLLNSHNGVFSTIETPDLKLYTIKELKNCTIPPMFILYQHQLFIFSSIYNNIAHYYGNIPGSEYDYTPDEPLLKSVRHSPNIQYELTYDFNTHTLLESTTIEQMKSKPLIATTSV